MVDQNYMDKLFQKLIDNSLTKKEYSILMEFIKKPKSQGKVKEMMDKYWDSTEVFQKQVKERTGVEAGILFDKIINKIESKGNTNQKPKIIPLIKKVKAASLYRVAATIVVIVGLFYFYQNDFLLKQPFPANSTIDPNAITLKLDNGNVEIISENGQREIIDPEGNLVGSQHGNQLKYSNKGKSEKLVYNELTVPYGKQFDLVLSDGTHVKLNAGSWIKYPVQFIGGENRKVYLKGEAYFDVTKDKAHPFVVNANEINVQVLGTQFNLSYYPEDSHINTVLVEGSVRLFEENKEDDLQSSILLTPGHKAAWDKTKKGMSIEKVDISIYTAWKDGVLLFKNTPFNCIRKKLERHFNISIEDQFHFLENQVYTASFRGEGIEEILNAFKEDTPFEYRIEGNKITITNQFIN